MRSEHAFKSLLMAVAFGACCVIAGGKDFRAHPAASGGGQPLTDEELAAMVGGDGCYNCHYAGVRKDECYHAGLLDPCQTNYCLANYAVESTCDLGNGTCTAYRDSNTPWVIQYKRADTSCTTNQPSGWSTWFTHYYGSGCTSFSAITRCSKTNGSCNGALIETSTRYPGIVCP